MCLLACAEEGDQELDAVHHAAPLLVLEVVQQRAELLWREAKAEAPT